MGNKTSFLYKKLNIDTVSDLILHTPRAYKDYSKLSSTSNLEPGDVSLKGKFTSVSGSYVRGGLHITRAIFSDSQGSVRVIWFNQPYRSNSISIEKEYLVFGLYKYSNRSYQVMNLSVEDAIKLEKSGNLIVPKYKETKGLKSFSIKKAVDSISDFRVHVEDYFPEDVVESLSFQSLADVYKNLHKPETIDMARLAFMQLAERDLFLLQVASGLNRLDIQSKKSFKVERDISVARKFTENLEYSLTNAQRRVAWQCMNLLDKDVPMNILIEGDVGSGKTTIGALSALMAISSGLQVAFVAPTTLVARQHFESLKKLTAHEAIEVTLLSGALKPQTKKLAQSDIASGKSNLIVGTHALFQESVKYKKLGLVIVDEQHKFGVKQREKIMQKAKKHPHLLAMTATPIPRSLALTMYGELDLGIIDELPVGRKKIATKVWPEKARDTLYKKIVDSKQQTYVVCKNIDSSEDFNSVQYTYDFLQKKYKNTNFAMLNGRMKEDEKDSVMQSFIDGEIQILVCTTVIEVGVVVPTATMMIIESADSFGLAQLHQLRGRVGRSDIQSYCYAISFSPKPTQRLQAFENSSDGFKLAELDLKLRGPGSLFGEQQSGDLDLRVSYVSDPKRIAIIKQTAQDFINNSNISDYPQIEEKIKLLRRSTKYN